MSFKVAFILVCLLQTVRTVLMSLPIDKVGHIQVQDAMSDAIVLPTHLTFFVKRIKHVKMFILSIMLCINVTTRQALV